MIKKSKNFLIAVLSLIICFSIFPVMNVDAAFNGIMKVRVSPENYGSSIRVSVRGDYFIKEKTSIVLNAGEYQVKQSGSSVQLLQNNNLLYSGSKLTIVRANTNDDYDYIIFHDSPSYDNNTLYYHGDMEFRISSGLCAINHVYIEDYVAGVLPYEMSMSWPIQALNAQAVAARNYGVRAAINNSSYLYYLDDTASTQVYKGIPWIDSSGNVQQEEYNKLKSILQATDRKVMKYNGSLFAAYFSAWNGGETLTAKGWTGNTSSAYGYTVVKADPYDDKRCQSAYWISRTVNTDLSISSAGDYNEKIQNMLIAKYRATYSVSGAVSITSTGGIKGMDSTEPLVSIVFEEFYCDVLFSTESSNKRIYFDDKELKSALGISSSYRAFRIENVSGGKTILHNVRYGHGVGLSQRGAQQMAEEGKDFSFILDFYYDYDSMETLSVSRPSLPSMPQQSGGNVDVDYIAKVINVNYYVNVRSGPGTNYSKIGEAPKGSTYTVKQEYYTSKWHQVDFNGKTGYIYSFYLQLVPVDSSGTAKLSSSTYQVDTSRSALIGVYNSESIGTIISRLSGSNGTIDVYSGSTKQSTSGKPKTGMTVRLTVNGIVSDQLTIIVMGDVNGDGKVSITDYTLARLQILGLKKLNSTQTLGADLNNDGKISITDYTLMRLDILGLKKIYRR